MRLLLTALLLAPLAASASDPEGTEVLELHVGKTRDIPAPNGSRMHCDDPSVVSAELSEGGLMLRAVAEGSTLCGVRKPGELPGGLYRVKVTKAPPEKPAKKEKGSP